MATRKVNSGLRMIASKGRRFTCKECGKPIKTGTAMQVSDRMPYHIPCYKKAEREAAKQLWPDRSNPGFFSKASEAGARRVKRVRLVKKLDTGEIGELLMQKPALLKEGWVKVKWRTGRSTLIQKSEITPVKASARAKIVDSDPTLQEKRRNPAQRKGVRTMQTGTHVRQYVARSRKVQALWGKVKKLQAEAQKEYDKGNVARAQALITKASVLATRLYDSGLETPTGTLPNPSQGGAGAGATSSDVRSPTRTEVRSPTKTSTVAHTRGNITVTGGAGAGATTSVKVIQRDRKKNPSVAALAETFQGRASGATADFKAADSAPANLARIGKLVFLKLRDKRAQISAPGAMVAVDTRGKLWLVGQGNMFSPKAKAKGEALDYGEVDRICYLTAKQHIGNGKQTEYVHTFGEDGGKRPRLLIDHDGMPILRGGDYQIRAEGIVN